MSRSCHLPPAVPIATCEMIAPPACRFEHDVEAGDWRSSLLGKGTARHREPYICPSPRTGHGHVLRMLTAASRSAKPIQILAGGGLRSFVVVLVSRRWCAVRRGRANQTVHEVQNTSPFVSPRPTHVLVGGSAMARETFLTGS
jgi:hypothetical protein